VWLMARSEELTQTDMARAGMRVQRPLPGRAHGRFSLSLTGVPEGRHEAPAQ